jgi:hypothetical protein
LPWRSARHCPRSNQKAVLIALEHHVSIEFLGIRNNPTDDHIPEVRASDNRDVESASSRR